MKITNKSLFIETKHELTIGKAIELTAVHQISLYKDDETGVINADVDFMDTEDVLFMGVPIEGSYKGFNNFIAKMLEFGIDVNQLIDDECVGIISDKEIEDLKIKYKNVFE